MGDLVKAIVMVSAVCYMAYADNVCSTKDSSGETDPLKVIGPYFKSPNFYKTYLSKFKTIPSLDAYLKIGEKASSDARPTANLLGWETAIFASRSMGKTHDELCEVPSLIRQSVAYEKSGDKKELLCVITFMAENSRRAVSDIIETAMDNVGCSGVYKKPIRPAPSCYYETCEASDSTLWRELYPIVDETFKKSGLSLFPETYDVLDILFKSKEINEQRVAGIWYSISYHFALLQKFGIADDPKVYNLVAKMVSFMEQIAFSKDCSCAERNQVLSKAEKDLSSAIDTEAELWRKTISL